MTPIQEFLETYRPRSVRQRIRSAVGWFAFGFLLAAMFLRFAEKTPLRTQRIQDVIDPVMAAERVRQADAARAQTSRPIIIIRERPAPQKGSDK